MNMSRILFIICKLIGFGLLYVNWMKTGDATGFFPIITLAILTILRDRVEKWWYSILIDGAILIFIGQYLVLSLIVLSEVFYRTSVYERDRGLVLRDIQANRYYNLELLQEELLTATAQVERMTAIHERDRIARDIHDNAGHEIVAAFISLHTVRGMIVTENKETLDLYDAGLERLNIGVSKIREAVHNLSTVNVIGVEVLRKKCSDFPTCKVSFDVFGDTTRVPNYVWIMFESCLSESLTNIVRHSAASLVKVDLVVTPHIVRLCIENDGVFRTVNLMGTGLRNLRNRATAIGGSLSIDVGEKFRIICVVPVQEI